METKFSPTFQNKLKQIKKHNPKLLEKIIKQTKIFQINQKHPSLRNHKLSGYLHNTRSLSVGMSTRILYNMDTDGSAYFFDIGTHDEIYKK